MKQVRKIAIVIINYNGNKDTLDCLKSIDLHCMACDYSVFLVDNASRKPFSQTELPRLRIPINYIQSLNNLGFAGGNNLAIKEIKQGDFDYIFLLNNDTVLLDDSVDRLVKKIENTPNIIGGIVNYYFDSPEEMWQAGSDTNANKLKSKERKDFDMLSDDLIFVDSIPGSSMMIPWEIIEKIGLFDERYFAYYEEVDFCERAKENGYQVAFLPNTRLLHKVGRASTSRMKHYLRTRNTLLFYSLHYKQYMFVAYLRVILRTIRDIINSKFKIDYVTPAIKGIIDYRHGLFGNGHIMEFV